MQPVSTVAVIIPTYNRSVLVAQALDSVILQTHPVDEIIVVDDGSTDDTATRLESYGGKIRYLRQRNAGKSAALNRALAVVDSDAVWILDDDDLLLPDAVARHVAFLQERRDIEFTYSGCLRFKGFTPPGNPFRGELYDCVDVAPSGLFIQCLQTFPFHAGGMLVPLRCYHRVGRFDENLDRGQDYDMILRLARRYIGGRVSKPSFLLREHGGARGPAASRHAASERVAVWRGYEKKIFLKVRRALALHEYLPADAASGNSLTSYEVRRALLQRACIMARHGLFSQAMEDLEAAGLRSFHRSALTPSERVICARMTDVEPEIMKCQKRFLSSIRSLSRQALPGLRHGAATGMYWSMARELRHGRYSGAVRMGSYLLGVIDPMAAARARLARVLQRSSRQAKQGKEFS